MKIIHTADIHLDSPLTHATNRQKRRLELLQALSNLSEYANNNNVSAIIIAGDLFDDQFTTNKTIIGVADFVSNSSATWFVLRGNHAQGATGSENPYHKLQQICPQVKFFGEMWQTYTLGEVNICGRELGNNDQAHWQMLQLPQTGYNILVLHGDVDDDKYGLIDKNAIANSHANYVALGHRHAFAEHKFGKVVGAYCGVLEPRGFDEISQTGFVLIDTDKRAIRFVPQAIRTVQTVTVDITGIQSEIALQNALLSATSQVGAHNYLNLVLVGSVPAELNVEATIECLNGRFFALRVDNKTQTAFDLQKISAEVSLRGEFVRKVLQLPQEDQAEVLKLGLALLSGGDLV
ncbi:MAG: metallophosphoesterase [Clostridia bacterium]|nr:metallophosphoesterase [Clostridia bacterium]